MIYEENEEGKLFIKSFFKATALALVGDDT